MYNCKKCNNPLEWADTINVEGGINEGEFTERQIWTCPYCEAEYVIERQVNFEDKPVKTIYFEEG